MAKCPVHDEEMRYCSQCVCASIAIEKGAQVRALARQREGIEKHVRGVTVDKDDTAYTILAKIRDRFRTYDDGGEEEE